MSSSVSDNRDRIIGSLLVFAAASLFGLHSALIKTAYANGVTVAQVFFYAFGVSFLFFGTLDRLTRKEKVTATKKQWTVLILGGIFGAGGSGLFLFWSYSYIPVALALTLMFLYVPWVFLWEYLLSRRKPTSRQWIAIGMVMAGVICGTNLPDMRWENINVPGITFGVLSSISYSTVLIVTYRLASVGTPVFRSMVFSGLVSSLALIVGLILPLGMFRPSIPWQEFALLIFMISAYGQLFPQWAFVKGIPMIGSAVAGILASIELPMAVMLSALVLRESVASIQWVGVALIVTAIVVANWPVRRMPDVIAAT